MPLGSDRKVPAGYGGIELGTTGLEGKEKIGMNEKGGGVFAGWEE